MTNKVAVASLKSVKSSPLKVRKVTNSIQGLSVKKALEILKFSNLKVASVVYSLVYSAAANAENNHGMSVDSLFVRNFQVGRAFALKRFSTRGRGKSSRILKTFSNLTVILSEKEVLLEIKKNKKEA